MQPQDSQVSPSELERTWFMPHEPIASIHTNLAMARFIQGDVAGTTDRVGSRRTAQ